MSGVSRFDCYPSDLLNGIIGMTADEIAAYVVILMLQYDRGDKVREEGRERELAIRAGMTRARFDKAAATLVTLGKIERTDGHLWNRRAETEIAKIHEKIARNRENSGKGGEANKANFQGKRNENKSPPEPTGYPDGYPNDSPVLRPSPPSIEEGNLTVSCPKPAARPRTKLAYSEDFEGFWSAYPTDALMSKKEAYAVWQRLPPEDRAIATSTIPAFKSRCLSDPDYRPVHAVRYLSQRRFEGFAKLAGELQQAKVFVRKGTSAWEAWAHHYRQTKGKDPMTTNRDGVNGWYFPSAFPPKDATLGIRPKPASEEAA